MQQDIVHLHVDESLVRRFLEEEDLSPAVNQLLLHAVASCPQCRENCGDLVDLWREGHLGEPEAFCFGAAEVFLGRSRRQAPELWRQLQGWTPPERQELLRSEARFHGWGLVELLCEESRRQASADPQAALELASLALTGARLAVIPAGASSWRSQLEALAQAHRANALRVLDDLPAADAVLRQAEKSWRALEDVCYFAAYGPQILSLKASLRVDQRRLDEAAAALAEALELCDEDHRGGTQKDTAALALLEVQLLIKQALVEEQRGDLERGVELLAEAREKMLGLEVEGRLRLCAIHNQFYYLVRLGRAGEAEALRQDLEALAVPHASAIDRLRIDYAKARLLLLHEDEEAAIEAFQAVRQGFLDRDLAYDAAITGLELALIHVRRRELAEVEALAAEMFAFFHTQEVPREALAALTLFHKAAAGRKLTRDFLLALTDYLHRARHDPRLSFRPAAEG